MATTSYDVRIRPMRTDDVADMERLSWLSYGAPTASAPGTVNADQASVSHTSTGRAPLGAAAWTRRTNHLLRTDPTGCWVAEENDQTIGMAIALKRETMWILASYAVLPRPQDQGIGRMLLAAAISHGRGALRGMLVSSNDPRAARHYRQAGFTLHPTMTMSGLIDRHSIPAAVADRVREGSAGDFDLMDSIDRRTRGSAHGIDHQLLLESFRLIVTDRSTGSGYAFVNDAGSPMLLAATNRRTATALLWEAIAASPGGRPVAIAGITTSNEWAIDIGLAAGLSLRTEGYLGLRHMRPPMPYLPNGAVL
jgi:GNAT superfamily N-acetyltransferase